MRRKLDCRRGVRVRFVLTREKSYPISGALPLFSRTTIELSALAFANPSEAGTRVSLNPTRATSNSTSNRNSVRARCPHAISSFASFGWNCLESILQAVIQQHCTISNPRISFFKNVTETWTLKFYFWFYYWTYNPLHFKQLFRKQSIIIKYIHAKSVHFIYRSVNDKLKFEEELFYKFSTRAIRKNWK